MSCRGSGRSPLRWRAQPAAHSRPRRSAAGSSSRRTANGRTSFRCAAGSRCPCSRRRPPLRPWRRSRPASGRWGSPASSNDAERTRSRCWAIRTHRSSRARAARRSLVVAPNGEAALVVPAARAGARGQGLRDLGLRERRAAARGPLRGAGCGETDAARRAWTDGGGHRRARRRPRRALGRTDLHRLLCLIREAPAGEIRDEPGSAPDVRPRAPGQSGGMLIPPVDRRKARLCGRVLVLLGIRNELQARRVPAWRQERNRIEIDRALAELAQH